MEAFPRASFSARVLEITKKENTRAHFRFDYISNDCNADLVKRETGYQLNKNNNLPR